MVLHIRPTASPRTSGERNGAIRPAMPHMVSEGEGEREGEGK
jgi:hypothetical protein